VKAISGKNKVLALFSVITIAAIVSGILLVPQMVNATETNGTDQTTQTSTTTTNEETNTTVLPSWNPYCMNSDRHNMRHGTRGFGDFGPIEVSEDFKQTVTSIAENDTDVQNLINDGYNITSVKPIISTVIDGEENVFTKATSAVLMLQKDTIGHATVMVNIDQAKVTQIVILTRTVIDKP